MNSSTDTRSEARNTVCTARSRRSHACRPSAIRSWLSSASLANAAACAPRTRACWWPVAQSVNAMPSSSAAMLQAHGGMPEGAACPGPSGCSPASNRSESGDAPKGYPMTPADWPSLYRQHLETLQRRADTALERAGRDHLVVPSGTLHYQAFDDRDYPYAVNPQFKAWLPLTRNPGSWLAYTPGARPKLVYLQPRDYWHVVPKAPEGYWVPHFDIVVVRTPEEALQHLPADPARCAIVGEPQSALGAWVPDNPPALVDYLEYHRAYKTPYEVAMMR